MEGKLQYVVEESIYIVLYSYQLKHNLKYKEWTINHTSSNTYIENEIYSPDMKQHVFPDWFRMSIEKVLWLWFPEAVIHYECYKVSEVLSLQVKYFNYLWARVMNTNCT